MSGTKNTKNFGATSKMNEAMNGRMIAQSLREMPGNAKVAFLDPNSGHEWRHVKSVEYHADENVIEIHLA